MPEEIVKLKDVKREEMPENLRAETYFDFSAHPFAHKELLDQTTSVYGAILAIDDYATKWLANAISEKREDASVLMQVPERTQTVGRFEVILEEGAVFEPARIFGS